MTTGEGGEQRPDSAQQVVDEGQADTSPETATGADAAGRRVEGQKPAAEQRNVLRGFVRSVTTAGSVWVSILAVFTAFVLGAILIVLSDQDVLAKLGYFFAAPGDALSAAATDIRTAYGAMFRGSIVDPSAVSALISGHGSWTSVFYPFSETVANATPLMLASLAVALGFRSGLFNIGAEGQMIAGGVLAGWVGFSMPHLPFPIPLLAALLAGFAGGAIWGGFAGLLRAKTGAHEVITTIMLNYIAVQLLLYLLNSSAFQRPGRTDPISRPVQVASRLPHLATDALRVNGGIVLALGIAALMWWILARSTLGFEVRAVGSNPDAARTAGMDVGGTYTRVMGLAGGFAGLGGAALILGLQYSLVPDFTSNIGFDAITVALLGRSTAVGVVLGALLFGALHAGGIQMQAATQTPVDVVTVIQSLTVLFIAAPAVVKAVYRLRGGAATSQQPTTKGWAS